jgi:glycosyltransferase involved in cell wall biosynthesis
VKTPKASFVIPVYNGQAFLAETLQSCIEQTHNKIEIIVVDDGSTDGTADILTHFQYLDERIKVICLLKNAGRSNARNKGIEAAQSDIILTLDADDICLPDRVEKTLKFFKKNPAIDIVYSDCHNIDVWGDLILFQDQNGNQTDTFPAMPFDIERLKKTLNTYIPCHSGLSFRKKVFEKVKYQEGDFCRHAIDDWCFEVDCYKAGFKFGQINRVLVRYRYIPKKRDEEKIKELKEAALV